MVESDLWALDSDARGLLDLRHAAQLNEFWVMDR